MGGTHGCQYKNCGRPEEVTCKCSNILLCNKCIELHKRQNPFATHEIFPLGTRGLNGEITPQSLEYHDSLYRSPEGATEVFKGAIVGRPQKVAIKTMFCHSTADLAKKQAQAQLMKAMTHPNVCTCLASFLDESFKGGLKFIIVMEYSELGDLEQQIDLRHYRQNKWPENEAQKHMSELIDAFAFLQDSNLIHGDIKPRNLFLTSGGKIKVGDFGESRHGLQSMVTRTYQVSGTVVYFSPLQFQAYVDIIKGKNAGASVRHNPVKSDVYSLGLTFLHMLSLTRPSELNNLQMGATELQNLVDSQIAQLDYPADMKAVLTRMLQVEEHRRYTFRQLKEFMDSLNQPKDVAQKPSQNRFVSPRRQASLVTQVNGPCLVTFPQMPTKAIAFELATEKIIHLSNIKFDPSSRVLEVGMSIVVTGGLKNPKMVIQVSLNGNSQQALPNMKVGRSFHAMVLYQGRIVVLGGKSANKRDTLKSNERMGEDQWYEFPPLVEPRESATAVSLGADIYIVGGSATKGGRSNMLGSVEKYHDEKWELLDCQLPNKLIGAGLVARDEQEVLIVGGLGERGAHKKQCYKWRVGTAQFEPLEDLPEADVFFQNSAVNVDGKCTLIGSIVGVFTFGKTWTYKPF